MSAVLSEPGGEVLADLSPGVWVVLGRAPGDADPGGPVNPAGALVVPVVVGAAAGLSRAAVWLTVRHDGGVRVVATQRGGAVLLDRVPWGQEARLLYGGEHVLRPGVFTVEMVNGGSLAKVVVSTELGGELNEPLNASVAGLTVPTWSASDVLNAGVTWQTVAALCVLAVGWPQQMQTTGAQKQVARMAGDLLGLGQPASQGTVSKHLDYAMQGLGLLAAPGSDKVPIIADRMLRARVLDDTVYRALDAQVLRRRAAGEKSRASIARRKQSGAGQP